MDPTTRQRDMVIRSFEEARLDYEALATLLACGELNELIRRYKGAGLNAAVYTADVDDSIRFEEVLRRGNLFVTDPVIYQILQMESVTGPRTVRMRRFHLPKSMTSSDAVELVRKREVLPCRLAELLQLGLDFPLLAQEEGILALGSSVTLSGITHFPFLCSFEGNRQVATRKVPTGGMLPQNQILLVMEEG